MTSTILIYSFDLLFFIMLVTISQVAAKRNSNTLTDIFFSGGSLQFLNEKHLYSIVIMLLVVIVYFFIHPENHTVLLPFFNPRWRMGFMICLVLVSFISLYAASKEINKKKRGCKGTDISNPQFCKYLVIRILYLTIYELFFRYVLLFQFASDTVYILAVSINTFLYTVLHAFNSKQEIYSSIPFGILLCCLTLLNHSIWPAIILHLLLALLYEIRLIFSLTPLAKSSDHETISYRRNRLPWS